MSLTDDMERLIELGLEPGAQEDPEFRLLHDYFAKLEEERRKNSPEVIQKEITDALTEALTKAIPARLNGRWRCECYTSPTRERVGWSVCLADTRLPLYPPAPTTFAALASPLNYTIKVAAIPREEWRFEMPELLEWRDKHGEQRIRMIIAGLAAWVSRHIDDAIAKAS